MSSGKVKLNDPSVLRIKKPDIECTPKKIAAIQEKLNVKSYFPTPRGNENKSCSIQGGSKKTRRKKSKTQKRRK